MDTEKSDKAQNDSFETIDPEKDNPVKKEFETGQQGREELQEVECVRDETDGARAIKNLPRENFNVLLNEGLAKAAHLQIKRKRLYFSRQFKKRFPCITLKRF